MVRIVESVWIVPVKQKANRFNPDEIRATKISLDRLGKRDKLRAFRPVSWLNLVWLIG